MCTEQEVILWVEECFEDEEFQEMEVTVTGIPASGSGYTGDVVFAKLTGITNKGGRAELNLAIKVGKSDQVLRNALKFEQFYVRELILYETVLPEFKKFQDERKILNYFDGVPKCYKTLVLQNREILVLENLRTQGYELHSKLNTMNDDHIKLILTNYAHFHAISLAYRDQEYEKFNLIFVNYSSVHETLQTESMLETYRNGKNKVYNLLKEGDPLLSEKFTRVFNKTFDTFLTEYLTDIPKESVITHGDCWNNNFLFKYEGDDKGHPVKVAILDWQVTSLHSPVTDLAYMLYAAASPDQLSRCNDFLTFYHDHLSRCIREMGSDPEKLFPFSTLMEHWKKYAVYGVVTCITFMDLMLCDTNDALSMEEISKNGFAEGMSQITTNKDEYRKRVSRILEHYFRDR